MLFRRISSQSKRKLEKFTSAVKNADAIVIDNNYDLARHLYEVKHENDIYLFSNLNANSQDSVRKLPKIDSENLYRFSLELIRKILEVNPKIKLFFINYPISGFEVRGRSEDMERVLRAKGLNESFRKGFENGSVPKNLTFIGCMGLPRELVSQKGALYFQTDFYDGLADAISLVLNDRGTGCKFFDGYIELKNFLTQSFSRHSTSPYSNFPSRNYWKPSVAELYPLSITDLYSKKFSINIDDSVATCGSCFAQHIGKRLQKKGYNYIDVEPQPKQMLNDEAKSLGYGIYSARYGNVYTSRQLVQLFDRAFGELKFNEVWKNKEGSFVDAFRPNLCGNGYDSEQKVLDEQKEHLANVRKMFETLDVFVFTMGVTETWVNKVTGAVYPICPGVTAGEFNPELYEFVNLDYATILDEMETFFAKLKEVNPTAKVLLTVSPVPLTATAENRHVLISTMASKAILRAVADQLYRKYDFVDYFPSYDIIMSPPFKSMFFKNNLRSIHEEGVDFVMSHFFAEHKLEGQVEQSENTEVDDEEFCDEAFLELERKSGVK